MCIFYFKNSLSLFLIVSLFLKHHCIFYQTDYDLTFLYLADMFEYNKFHHNNHVHNTYHDTNNHMLDLRFFQHKICFQILSIYIISRRCHHFSFYVIRFSLFSINIFFKIFNNFSDIIILRINYYIFF